MGNVVSAVAQIAVSATLVVAGAALAAASFGGAGLVASTLISAGVAGAATTITSLATSKGCPSWTDWGKQTAIGAVTGLLAGGFGAVAGGLAKAVATPLLKAAWIVGGSVASSVACNTLNNGFTGQKWNAGLSTAAVTGVLGGVFACGATGLGSWMKASGGKFVGHPLTRHTTGTALDSLSSAATGAVGAAIDGQDAAAVGRAAWIGAASGAAVSGVTSAVRGGAKNRIRARQKTERELVLSTHGPVAPRVEGDVTIEYDHPTVAHRDERHVDLHHTQLKNRSNVPKSSRFQNRKVAQRARELTSDAAVQRMEALIHDPDAQHIKAALHSARVDLDASIARGDPQRIVDPLRTALKQAKGAFSTKFYVDVTVDLGGGAGYGYHTATKQRVDGISGAQAYFVPTLQNDGNRVTWRESSLFPNMDVHAGRRTQGFLDHDRQFRRRYVQRDLGGVARHSVASTEREREHDA